MTTKVCIYTRVSTVMQVDGFSLIGQEEEIRKYCSVHGMEVVATYSDRGKSGKTLAGREDFQKMITDIDTGVINVKYVMVYKLSRFGRSVLDIERTLQILRENDVNLICVADGLDTSTPMGKVITTIMSSLAEMELENIHTQTMLGRQQKARDGLWNGGQPPYGYHLENGRLMIDDDEADAIKKIFELYTTTELGVVGIVKWLFEHGYRKEIRANGTKDVFTRAFVSKAIENPIYKGEIVYGRRHMLPPDKKGERKMVKKEDYIRAAGKHEPIITEEQFEAAQKKRKTLAPLAQKREDSTHVHMLATLIKCPVCGAPMYGNTTRKKKRGTEDEYTPYHFYACKHRLKVDGKPCTYRKNINEKNIDEPVIAIITKLAGDKRLAELVADKLGDVVDEQETLKAIETTEREIRIRESSLKRLSSELDRIDPEAPYAERRIKDTSARIDALYEELAGFENDLADFKQKLEAIRQKKLTVEKVYTVLQHFGTLIDVITEEECQMLMRTLIDEIQIFEDKQPDGRIIKSVKLSIPVVYDGEISARIGLDKNDHDESIVTMVREESGEQTRAFFENARFLRDKFGITPLLYGSLGLEYLTGKGQNADDIDILIPKTFLTDRWAEFQSELEKAGYSLIDEHEHTFEKDAIHYSYAQIEELESFAGIPMGEIPVAGRADVPFKLLSLAQYLKVYAASAKDGYRTNTKGKKDSEKVALLRELLSTQSEGSADTITARTQE